MKRQRKLKKIGTCTHFFVTKVYNEKRIKEQHSPLLLQGRHNVVTRMMSLTLSQLVGDLPYQNLQFLCYFSHPVEDFLASDLYDCKNETIIRL